MQTNKIVSIVITVVIFGALVGVIAGNVANPDGNLTGASLTLYGLRQSTNKNLLNLLNFGVCRPDYIVSRSRIYCVSV